MIARILALLSTSILLLACSDRASTPAQQPKAPAILEDISGVWRAQDDGTMVSLVSQGDRFRVLFGETPIPATVGAIDPHNKTVNLNVSTQDGRKQVWTLRQVFQKEKETFHLMITLSDGTQDELSFVRRISSDDLALLDRAESKDREQSEAKVRPPIDSLRSAPNAQVLPNNNAPVPSAPATEGVCKGLDLSITVDQLECIGKKYAISDRELNRLYKSLMASLGEDRKATLLSEQRAWIKQKQTKCATAGKEFEGGTLESVVKADCELKMTDERVAYLASFR